MDRDIPKMLKKNKSIVSYRFRIAVNLKNVVLKKNTIKNKSTDCTLL